MSYSTMLCESEEEWLKARMGIVGASESAAALGLSPYLSRYALWARKTRRSPPEDSNERMMWGRLLEAPIAAEYAKRTGRILTDPGRFTLLVMDGTHLACTVDRFIQPIPGDSRGRGCLEVKNLGILPESEWEEGGPLIYQIQHQSQMAVTGLGWGVLCPLVGGNRLRPMDAYRDEPFIQDTLLPGVEEFWWFVENDKAPPIDGSESTQDALQDLRRGRKLREVTLPAESLVLAAQFDLAKAKAEEAKFLLDQTTADLKDLMLREGAEIGTLPDGTPGFKWVPQNVKASRCSNCGNPTRAAHERSGFARATK